MNGDYHLKSTVGRYDPVASSWAADAAHSPCIDTGDPASPVDGELEPNGTRINMGAYGGTVEASMGTGVWPPTPGLLAIDTTVMNGATLNLNAPACNSLGILSIDANGNPADAQFAILIGADPGSGWLRFEPAGIRGFDVRADGVDPEPHTAAEWAGKRLRWLAPGTDHTFYAKTLTDGLESDLVQVGIYSTSAAGDVNWTPGLRPVRGSDYALVRRDILEGDDVGLNQSWACEVDGDGFVTIGDLLYVMWKIKNP
ncbi:hypothetical protein HQ560_21110 [bacterium]|nr:hypothetical protein [bacterium]